MTNTRTSTNINNTIHTSGEGYWSNEKRAVRIVEVKVTESDSHFEINVIFDTSDWNSSESGLIYTDPLALNELKTILADHVDYDLSKLDYSEQGMQGYDYLSLELSKH